MPLRQIHAGAAYAIFAYEASNGRCQVEEYLDQLELRDQKRVTALLLRAAASGPPRNTEKSAAIEDFFEFKAHQVRIFWCYAPGKRIVLFHGFTKKSRKTPANELETGRRLSQEVRDDIEAEGVRGAQTAGLD